MTLFDDGSRQIIRSVSVDRSDQSFFLNVVVLFLTFQWLTASLTYRKRKPKTFKEMYGDDLRLGDIIVHGDQGNIVLLGFPYDEGVTRNSGRAGAKFGPSKFREFLRRTGTVVNPEYDDVDLRKYLTISDGGNIEEDLCLEEAHQRLQKRVRDLLYQEKIVFVVGGGNDQSYPNASALLDYLQSKSKSIVVINIDAHLDVRPLKNGHQAHSGSPFRQLLEDQRFNGNPMSLNSFFRS